MLSLFLPSPLSRVLFFSYDGRLRNWKFLPCLCLEWNIRQLLFCRCASTQKRTELLIRKNSNWEYLIMNRRFQVCHFKRHLEFYPGHLIYPLVNGCTWGWNPCSGLKLLARSIPLCCFKQQAGVISSCGSSNELKVPGWGAYSCLDLPAEVLLK